MRAGELRHRVAFKADTPTQDDFGEPIESWTTYMTVWAAIEPLEGRELLLAQQVSAEVTIRVRIRYDSANTVSPEHRIIEGSRILEIVNVINPLERNEKLTLMCKEIV